ncbi:hypothetical protein, conserved [Trypanosoma brucei gambiense DAL972]|uniref:J domain-containing protein n=1 Tax=Trypanosoma brucei gambiense (strain MHOM/CI/86/DAL972) TaxID=679716 RepID=D0A799_TRYB9|nr:hypothetical protein, conserved [Trypanosoma brucei gambiense DAL972]CBH17550.1 hypothetical protein, conserved [Trypanosoma brucei gambiense DAL972]|eukprot:XP_011779814.1 hypothetical protein, conserved [Trypanosoma brucei gambiense DAL972]
MLSRSAWVFAMSPRAALTALGIQFTSNITQATVKKAYIAQTLRCHPDLNPEDPNATEKFRTISEALRVVLKSLEARRNATAPGEGAKTTVCPAFNDPDGAIETLRQAIAAYHRHREIMRSAAFVAGKNKSVPAERVNPFVDNSLEHVSFVCRSEAVAMQRVRRFCNELPEVLCGRSCALFEAVAFFNSRYVEATSQCVLRFSKNLPIIVSRVVKNRKKYVRYTQNKAISGFGTGSRPQRQRIEDMSMKPLVLVGALIFDQGGRCCPNAECSCSSEHSGLNYNLHNCNQSTCGAVCKEELKICDELKCVINPSDSIGDITENIGRWEAASFNRLQLELAMVDITSLISGILELNDHPLTMMNHLHLPKSTSERVSLTLQKLACGLCHHCGEHERGVTTDVEASGSHRRPEITTIADRINFCRHLAHTAASYIKGNIILVLDDHSSLVEGADEVVVDEVGDITTGTKLNSVDCEKDYQVARHMSCCTAEMIQFSVSVKLSKDVEHFLDCVIAAMTRVSEEAESSVFTLPTLLELRERVVQEEFIPVGEGAGQLNADAVNEGVNCAEKYPAEAVAAAEGNLEGGSVETDSECRAANQLDFDSSRQLCEVEERCDAEYRYRGPIRCFPRIFSMDAQQELLFWKNVRKHRLYLARRAPAMNSVNIYYDCMPYDPHRHSLHHDLRRNKDELFAGWVGEAEEGVDDAVITKKELQSSAMFLKWLEDVAEQSSLNKECQRIVRESGIGYISRDPLLPLQHYLSFVKVFSAAATVRSIIESGASNDKGATSENPGLFIVVGTECDVRDGGRLLVPWWMDPLALLALLQCDDAQETRCLNGGAAASPSAAQTP